MATKLVLLMGGIYDVRRWDGLKCLDIIPSFIKTDSPIQKLIGGGGYTDRHTHTYRQQGDLISLLLFYQNKESRLKKE
jgi:hypothetical protein